MYESFFPVPGVSSFHTETGMKKDDFFSRQAQNLHFVKEQMGRQHLELTWKGLVEWLEAQFVTYLHCQQVLQCAKVLFSVTARGAHGSSAPKEIFSWPLSYLLRECGSNTLHLFNITSSLCGFVIESALVLQCHCKAEKKQFCIMGAAVVIFPRCCLLHLREGRVFSLNFPSSALQWSQLRSYPDFLPFRNTVFVTISDTTVTKTHGIEGIMTLIFSSFQS